VNAGRFPLPKVMLGLGYVFLYLPILSLIVYSFNESRLVTVWSGFSVKWYGELFQDQQMIDAAWMSLRIAFFTACASVVLATMAGMVMVRFRRFAGKTAFGGLITAPLVMPEVITGLSLLLLFVTIGELGDALVSGYSSLWHAWNGGGNAAQVLLLTVFSWIAWLGDLLTFFKARGMTTIWIAHVTFCMAFATVVISSRLSELDRSLEEAAMDLGANRVKVFFLITLPIITPALISAWLLSFTLSVDDLVISSFVSGPASTTLPMKVFSSVRLGVSPKINALATLLILAVSMAALVGWWLMARDEKRRQRDMQMALQQG
jgi:putrescine transport system permease protein